MEIIEKLLEIAPELGNNLKRGQDYVLVTCPFHGGGQEKTPSLSISTWKPVFLCHGCKEAGHVSQLFRHYGLSREHIDVIIPRTEYTKEKTGPVAAKLHKNQDPFRGKYILHEDILDAYRLKPTSLERDGYHEMTLRHFEVGYDSKNIRITYPLRTVFGELVGISGRTIIEGVEPRYKIYDGELKEREDFKIPKDYTMSEVKSSILWHGHVVRPLLFLHDKADTELIITEGFKACMWVWQAGHEDVVALVGSYLTPFHAELIARATRRALLFLDADEAGIKGTRWGGRLLTEKGVAVRVASYPEGAKQPDDLTKEGVAHAIEQAQSLRRWSAQHPEQESFSKLLKQTKKR